VLVLLCSALPCPVLDLPTKPSDDARQIRASAAGSSGLDSEVVIVARQRLAGAGNLAAFSESETERRSRFGSSERSVGFAERPPRAGSERTVTAVAEPEPTDRSPVVRVGTGDRPRRERSLAARSAEYGVAIKIADTHLGAIGKTSRVGVGTAERSEERRHRWGRRSRDRAIRVGVCSAFV